MFGRRKRPDYEHIEQLERENGLDDGTFSDEWVETMQERLTAAGIGLPPEKREFFKPPILEKNKPTRIVTQVARSFTSTHHPHLDDFSYQPGAVWYVNDPTAIQHFPGPTQVLGHKYESKIILPTSIRSTQ